MTQLEKLAFMSTDCLVIHESGIDRKPIERRFQIFNFQIVINSSFCNKGPWNSIEHKIRKRVILTFTFFSIRQLENPAFYLHVQV